jgi:hypothetical protein
MSVLWSAPERPTERVYRRENRDGIFRLVVHSPPSVAAPLRPGDAVGYHVGRGRR